MAEVLAAAGVIAAVSQLADYGFKLSIKLFSYSEAVSRVDKSILSLSNEISLTSAVLKELGGVLQEDETKFVSRTAIEATQNTVKECFGVFETLTKLLDGAISSSKKEKTGGVLKINLGEKLKWPFLEPKIKLLQVNLDRLKSNLALMLQVLNYARDIISRKKDLENLAYQKVVIEKLSKAEKAATQKYKNLQKAIGDAETKKARQTFQPTSLSRVTTTRSFTGPAPPPYENNQVLSAVVEVKNAEKVLTPETDQRATPHVGELILLFSLTNNLLTHHISNTQSSVQYQTYTELQHATNAAHKTELDTLRKEYGDGAFRIGAQAAQNALLLQSRLRELAAGHKDMLVEKSHRDEGLSPQVVIACMPSRPSTPDDQTQIGEVASPREHEVVVSPGCNRVRDETASLENLVASPEIAALDLNTTTSVSENRSENWSSPVCDVEFESREGLEAASPQFDIPILEMEYYDKIGDAILLREQISNLDREIAQGLDQVQSLKVPGEESSNMEIQSLHSYKEERDELFLSYSRAKDDVVALYQRCKEESLAVELPELPPDPSPAPSFVDHSTGKASSEEIIGHSPEHAGPGDKRKESEGEIDIPSTGDMDNSPIKFKDAVGRKFSFPWHTCKTWTGMEALICQAFLHVDEIGQYVREGHYDLIGPDGELILSKNWESIVKPGVSITMHMWPKAQLKENFGPPTSPLPDTSALLGPLPTTLGRKTKSNNDLISSPPPPPPPPPPTSGRESLSMSLPSKKKSSLAPKTSVKKFSSKSSSKGPLRFLEGNGSSKNSTSTSKKSKAQASVSRSTSPVPASSLLAVPYEYRDDSNETKMDQEILSRTYIDEDYHELRPTSSATSMNQAEKLMMDNTVLDLLCKWTTLSSSDLVLEAHEELA